MEGALREAVLPHSGVYGLLRDGQEALFGAGDLQLSRQRFDAAYRAAERAGEPAGLAAAALGLGGLWVHEHRTAAAATVVRQRQFTALSTLDADDALALRLRARLAGEADYVNGEHAAILSVLEDARRSGDAEATAEALSLAHHCLLGPEHGPLRRDLALELVGTAARTGRRADLLMGLLWRTVDLLLDGDPHAQRSLGELRSLLARADHLAVGYVVDAMEVMLLIRAGRLDDAETRAGRCAQRGAAAGDADATGWYCGQLVTIRWFQGRIAEILPTLNELVHSPTLSAIDNSLLSAFAVSAAYAGETRQAAGALARLTGRDLGDLPRSSSWMVSMYGVVETANKLDDPGPARRAYALLRPFARLPMMASLGVSCFGSVHHALGVAALTMGDAELAIEHLRTAIEHNLGLGHWPAVAMSRFRLSQALSSRGRPHDVGAARRESAQAAREALELGIRLPRPVEANRPDQVSCRRRGRQWSVELGRRNTMVDHSVGMLHLATLLANPGREIAATDLAAGPGLLAVAAHTAGVQPVLDDVAKREYRERLAQLDEQIAQSEVDNEGRLAERDWLLAELAATTGIGGRTRPFTGNEERARVAVGKAIRRAIARIEELDAVIGEALRATIHTGQFCCYNPSSTVNSAPSGALPFG